jgi:hypothetical protein
MIIMNSSLMRIADKIHYQLMLPEPGSNTIENLEKEDGSIFVWELMFQS